jgi:hypothetical protein
MVAMPKSAASMPPPSAKPKCGDGRLRGIVTCDARGHLDGAHDVAKATGGIGRALGLANSETAAIDHEGCPLAISMRPPVLPLKKLALSHLIPDCRRRWMLEWWLCFVVEKPAAQAIASRGGDGLVVVERPKGE